MGATGAYVYRDAVAKIKKITNNVGATYTFRCRRHSRFHNGMRRTGKRRGTVGLIGIPTEDLITYNPHRLRTKEIKIQNVRRSNQTMHDCVKLFSDDFELERIITHSFDLNDVQKGFDLVSKFKDNVIKCVITNNSQN